MVSQTINPSVDQGALEMFEENFYELAQQTKSRLVNSGVFKFLTSKGKINNVPRMGRLELVKVDTRNPDKQFSDYAIDNRQFSKDRYTLTVVIDAKDDINELITDPTSDIINQLNQAKERQIDRVGVAAAVGNVLVGAPDQAPTIVSAAQDGVLTVDGTTGFNYNVVQKLTQNFINNDLEKMDFRGTMLAISGTENTQLMNEDRFINNDFINGNPVETGYISNAGMYHVEMFAGSDTGGIQVPNPILPEGETIRQCVALAPMSVAVSMELDRLDVMKSATKVNSYDITIDFWIGAMRMEGARVQIINTTI